MKIDAFPQQDPTQESKSVIDAPKIESPEPIKAVEEKIPVQNASPVESTVPVSVPVPSEQKETPSLNTDASKQNKEETLTGDPETKAKNSNLPEVKPELSDPTSETKTPVKNNDDSLVDGIESEMSGDASGAAGPESSEEDQDNSAKGSGSQGYLKLKDLLQRIQERLRNIFRSFEIERKNYMSNEDSESNEESNINFPSFAIYNSDELQ